LLLGRLAQARAHIVTACIRSVSQGPHALAGLAILAQTLTPGQTTQFLNALERPVIIVNLDPAAPTPPYPSSISITSLISLSDAMTAHSLGPNGAMLYCLEYLEANMDWLEEELERVLEEVGWTEAKREEAFVVFDTPGQVELSTDHGSLKRIVERLGKKGGWRVSSCGLLQGGEGS
jgi:hypothetical protein